LKQSESGAKAEGLAESFQTSRQPISRDCPISAIEETQTSRLGDAGRNVNYLTSMKSIVIVTRQEPQSRNVVVLKQAAKQTQAEAIVRASRVGKSVS
jgi:hypothetical protein